jgi:glycosyltransferase involved in cell wall biosynthesis
MVSVIITAYNEAGHLYTNVREMFNKLAPMGSFETILVDDGSLDATWSEIGRLEAGCLQVRGCSLPLNTGKGAALRAGTAMAQGNIIVYYDADLEIPPEEIPRLVAILLANDLCAVVGKKLAPPRTPWRRLLTAGFRLLCAMSWRGLPDTQTGIKVFRRDILLNSLADTRLNGYLFDLELILALSRRAHGARLGETEVESVWNRATNRIGLTALTQCALEFWSIWRRFRPRAGWEGWMHVHAGKDLVA